MTAPTAQASDPHTPEVSSGAVTDGGTGFQVHLEVFEGPFDLLLQLISKHKLDITEIALSTVTDEFIAHIRTFEGDWPLEQTTEFLVVASTLLDLKAARLLPSGEIEDEEDLALLEARDLLFARLMQYRAYKEVAGIFSERMAQEIHRHPRSVSLEPQFAGLLPEVLLGLGPVEFSALAERALAPKVIEEVAVGHLHMPRVSVAPLQDLLVRWIGDDDAEIEVSEEFDLDPSIDEEAPTRVKAVEAVPVDDDTDRLALEEDQ